jgi:hypothetical protein
MSSPAPKQAETEFDDLLGQLVDELAMTPASESAVQLVPDPAPVAEVRVDSTHHLAAEAAAAAQARVVPGQSNNLVKIVGIIAASLTVVAVAALMTFGSTSSESADEDATVASEQAESERLAEQAAAEQAAAERAEAQRVEAERRAAEQAEIATRNAEIEAKLLAEDAQAIVETKTKATTPKPRVRNTKPKPKPAKPKPGDSFEDL